MTKPFIFISCGQYTEAERALGSAIAKMVTSVTGLDAFFAQDVQDLNGLDSNILAKLHDCAAFITVLHPRGKIVRPGGSEIVRASVWIEQEIAVATYIQRVEKRPLPVIAFTHRSVGLEGIRSLLQLNPIAFSNEDEVLTALRKRLPEWRGLAASISVQLRSVAGGVADDHRIRRLVVTLVNDTNQRITQFTCRVRLPAATLKHWRGFAFVSRQQCRDDNRYECLQFDEYGRGPVPPRDQRELLTIDYCTMCASVTGEHLGVDNAAVTATVWIESQEYEAKKTIQELAMEAAARGEG